MKDKAAVHPIGTEVGQDVANVKVQIVVGTEEGTEPCKKCTVKGIDAADYKE